MLKRTHLSKNQIKGFAGCVLLAAGFALLGISRICKEFANWYSLHIYPVWVESIGRLAGLFPFSVAEILLYLLIGTGLLTGVIHIVRIVRKKEHKGGLYSWLLNLFFLAGLLLFLYAANCGMNYYRTSFSEISGIRAEEYSTEDLKEVCLWLTQEVNGVSSKVKRDGRGVMVLEEDVREDAVKAMQKLGETYGDLSGYYPNPKGLLFPEILSIQNLTGVYSPFTIEANYNPEITDYNIPFTMCHELSHLRGFMQEEEANFIAFLACRESGEAQLQYSGNLMGWIYCMNVLHKTDYEAWKEVRARLSPDVEPDLQANREFWAQYDGTVAEVANKVNDTYLKANGQANGVKSYNQMVDFIVANHKKDWE